MHDARFMCGAKSVSGLDCDVQRLVELHSRIRHAPAERFSIDELSGNKAAAVGFSDLVNRQNVWMIQSRSCARFLFEAPQPVTVSGRKRGKKFKRHFAAEFRILSKVNFAHAALS